MRATPKGGFGNRVLTYLTIRHLARTARARYFFTDPDDRGVIRGIHRPQKGRPLFGREAVFRAADTARDGFLEEVISLVSSGTWVSFKGPLLGEVLARFARIDSRELTALTATQCSGHLSEAASKNVLALHLRAGDFRLWEPAAILPAEYYIAAVDSISGLSPDSWHARLCIDDRTHPALEEVVNHLSSRGFSLSEVECPNPFMCDLAAMAQAEVLVSSPSTFALVAGLLGAPRVIHSKKWVENRVSREEDFWRQIGQGVFPGYSLEALV